MSSNGFVGFTSTDIISREPSSQHFEGNQNLGFQIVRFADGSFGIEKSIKDWTGNKTGRLYRAELLASQEYLAARVGQALNAPIRDCLFTSTDGTTVIMPFVIGQSGKELGGKDVPDDAQGLQLHIFDHLVANSDRRPKNLMFTQNGIIGIDHALCNFRPRSPKPELLASLYNAGIKSNTIRELEPVLESTKPYFAQLQMLDKFENLMFNLIRLVADLQIVEQAASVVKSVEKDAFTPPQSVQEAAQKALEWMKEGKAGSGFTPVGRKRASDLARGATVSEDTIRRMKAYFDRHQPDKKSPHWDEPSPGKVAWYAWGGDAGYSWAKSVVEKLNKIQKGDVPGHEFHGNQYQQIVSEGKEAITDKKAKELAQLYAGTFRYRPNGSNAHLLHERTPAQIQRKLAFQAELHARIEGKNAEATWGLRKFSQQDLEQAKQDVENFMTAVEQRATPSETELLRGVALDKNTKFDVGSVVEMPLASWDNGTRNAALSWAKGGLRDESKQAFVFHAPEGTLGTTLAQMNYGSQRSQTLTGGNFVVSSVDVDKKGRTDVYLVQQQFIAKGDVVGHTFHGNQYTGGLGGGEAPLTQAEQQAIELWTENCDGWGSPSREELEEIAKRVNEEAPELWRGIQVYDKDYPKLIKSLQVGETVKLPFSSWSRKKLVGEQFASDNSPMGNRSHNYIVFHTSQGARGVNAEPYAIEDFKYQAEWLIPESSYKVVSVTKDVPYAPLSEDPTMPEWTNYNRRLNNYVLVELAPL